MRADRRLARTIASLPDPVLRRDFVIDCCDAIAVDTLARELDALALAAEQGEELAKEALVAVIDAMNDRRAAQSFQRLREEAAGAGLVTLDRLLRRPAHASSDGARASVRAPAPGKDYGYGRPLTLGERKSLAKRPDRNLLERLLGDPHPDVIRGVLRNPRLTEDDVVRFVARRGDASTQPELLAEVARCTQWAHRPRIRLALVLNPLTPAELCIPLTGLLLRHELRLVVEAAHVAAAVRATCLEHLRRKYPHDRDDLPIQ